MKKFSPVLVAVITATFLEFIVCSKQNEPPMKYCSDNETCSNTVEYSYCDFEEKLQCGVGVCNCLPTHVLIGNDMDPTQPEISCSRRPILIGATCKYDVECTATFGDLSAGDPTSNTCICDTSVSIPDRKNETCLPLRKHLSMDCREDSQCLPLNSTCEYKNRKYVCGCSRSDRLMASLETPDTCLREARHHGDICQEDIQCLKRVGKYSECSLSNNTCQCKQGYGYYGYVEGCWPIRQLRQDCSYSEQCVDRIGSNNYTDCRNHICQCFYSELAGICYPDRKIDDSCELSAECKASIIGQVLCTGNTCRCDDNYVSSLDRKSCIKG